MIQIRVLRRKHNGELFEKPLLEDVSAASVQKLFADIPGFLAKIPEEERWNVYYSLGFTNGGHTRSWHGQEVIPFDIDHVADEHGAWDKDATLKAVFDVLRVDPKKCVVVFSGHGLQILVQPPHPVPDKGEEFFRLNRDEYEDILEEMRDVFKERGLRGEMDVSAFSPNRLFRMPGTINRKPEKEDRRCEVILSNLEPQEFRISPPPPGVKAEAKPWEPGDKGALSPRVTAYMRIDHKAVEEGCLFLKQVKAHPEDVNEPQWYAALSIVSRFDDGVEKAHEYSRGHPGYRPAATDRKIKQALAASGPRLCKNIESLWDGCPSCPFYAKVQSPVMIKGADFISTESSGFHTFGKGGSLIPVIEDLRKYFAREYPYKVNDRTRTVYVYESGQYVVWSKDSLRAFAEKQFIPKTVERDVIEFYNAITRTNQVTGEWMSKSTEGLINFENGIYDIENKTLAEHTPDVVFQYKLPFAYDERAMCPTFDRFIKDVTLNDPDLEEILVEFLGYIICDREYWLQKSIVLLGEGSNGKSTFLEVTKMLIGVRNISFLSFHELFSETSRAQLRGRLLNISDELPTEGIRSTDLLKKLYGGTSTSRKLYEDLDSSPNMAKFIWAGNDMPATSDLSKGFFRRFCFVPFRANFELTKNADTKIVQKMALELPGIFNRVIAAYGNLLKRGDLPRSEASEKTLEAYKDQVDRVGLWVKENLIVHPLKGNEDKKISIADAFQRFHQEGARSQEKAISLTTFKKNLKRHVPGFDDRLQRARMASGRVNVLEGVSFDEHEKPHF